ncbi:PREDICTED: probable protein phosphatase CG10417 [Rhagoletis zephyria]|uniref:probable protein phosphatase CG10417 n=1 Tax=Rhagoletis zephyria TaxID=28612 RepID=UPI000811A2FC|nr:PREDICTED: probable protein phosphatase CG10417 [Rhagoletis zephyria]KAH9398369.1 hypothetical protein TYRP_019016 [Tyrophagus putrescentiae]
MANVYLKEAIRTMETSSGTAANYEYASTSCQGWRNTQEDVHLILPNFDSDTSLFAVFDGHNGIEVAAYVAKYLPEYIRQNRKYKRGRVSEGLKEAFCLLDGQLLLVDAVNELRAIRRQAHPELPEYKPGITSGCTAVVCLLKKDTFYCASIGDTRCVLCRNGKAFPLSIDNKPDDANECARIMKAGGEVVHGRINKLINVSRAFGDHMFKMVPNMSTIEQMIIPLPDVIIEPYIESTDSFMVLMCDGIWNSMDNSEVIDFVGSRIQKKMPLAKITEEVIKNVLPKEMPPSGIKGKDNMTICVIKFKGKRGGVGSTNMSAMPRTTVRGNNGPNKHH